MSENSQTKRRVSYYQQLELWKFLSSHREIAVGYNKTLSSREHNKRMWDKVAEILNFSEDGATKSGTEWSKYWIDIKAKIRKKNRLIKDSKTGKGDTAVDQSLSDIEEKFLNIFDEDLNSGLPASTCTDDPLQLSQEDGNNAENNPDTSQPIAGKEHIYLKEKTNESESHNDDQISNAASVVKSPYSSEEDEEVQESKTHKTPLTVPGPSTEQGQRNKLRSNLPRQGTGQGPRRHQRRPVRHMTGAEARERLVFAAEARARAQLAISRSFESTINILTEMTSIMKRIEAKYDTLIM